MSFISRLSAVLLGLIAFSASAHAIDFQVNCVTKDGLSIKSDYMAGGDGPMFLWQASAIVSYRSSQLVQISETLWDKSPVPGDKYFYNYAQPDGSQVVVEVDPTRKVIQFEDYYWMTPGFLTLDVTTDSGRRVTRNHVQVKCYSDGRSS